MWWRLIFHTFTIFQVGGTGHPPFKSMLNKIFLVRQLAAFKYIFLLDLNAGKANLQTCEIATALFRSIEECQECLYIYMYFDS